MPPRKPEKKTQPANVAFTAHLYRAASEKYLEPGERTPLLFFYDNATGMYVPIDGFGDGIPEPEWQLGAAS